MNARISAVSRYLPKNIETNDDLAELFPEWSPLKIASKTGINQRHVADATEFSSHLATKAGLALLQDHHIDPSTIDALILVTQSPDFALPTTACIVHAALDLPQNSGAFDLNLGCSGYVVGLSVAQAMIDSGQVSRVLLLTADTYTKYLNPLDKTVRTIFGDGATATLVESSSMERALEAFVSGTNGKSAGALMVPNGTLRQGTTLNPNSDPQTRGLEASDFDLFMDGPSIFNFTLDVVGPTVDAVLAKANLSPDDVDLFVFHQANKFMLDHLVAKMGLPEEKVPVVMGEWGNTVSSTIPMALVELRESGRLTEGMTVVLVGFGVGLSWAGIVARF